MQGPGEGVRIDRVGGEPVADYYSFINAIFWGNAPGRDFAASCDKDCGKVRVNVSHSMVQTKYVQQGLTVTFGDGIMAPVDPLFADPANGDFHLKSTAGRWTPTGYVTGHRDEPGDRQGLLRRRGQREPRARRQAATSSAPTATAARHRMCAECAGGVLLRHDGASDRHGQPKVEATPERLR